MNRRDLLDPRRAASAAGHVLGALDLLPDVPQSAPIPDEVALVRLGYRAMATGFEVLLPQALADDLSPVREAFDALDDVEDRLTVYRDSSEVSAINRLAASRPVVASPDTFALLQLCERLFADTAGCFDPAVGTLVKAWGFFKPPRRVPAEATLAAALAASGMCNVELHAPTRSVRFRRPGVEVNFGSVGKGWGLDRMADVLRGRGVRSALLHGGSSSVLAVGGPRGDDSGWPIDIRRPWGDREPFLRVHLRDRALGTSAATFQFIEHLGRKLGHVIDPRTGRPAAGIDSASVLAPTAAEADALSTAVFVGGLEVAEAVCAARPDISAVVLPEGEVEPRLYNLSAADYNHC